MPNEILLFRPHPFGKELLSINYLCFSSAVDGIIYSPQNNDVKRYIYQSTYNQAYIGNNFPNFVYPQQPQQYYTQAILQHAIQSNININNNDYTYYNNNHNNRESFNKVQHIVLLFIIIEKYRR